MYKFIPYFSVGLDDFFMYTRILLQEKLMNTYI